MTLLHSLIDFGGISSRKISSLIDRDLSFVSVLFVPYLDNLIKRLPSLDMLKVLMRQLSKRLRRGLGLFLSRRFRMCPTTIQSDRHLNLLGER